MALQISQTITLAPDAPNRLSPDNFATKAANFVAWLEGLDSEMNTYADEANALATEAEVNAQIAADAAANPNTSTTSLTIGTGDKTLVTATGIPFYIGQVVRIIYADDGTQWMQGDITAYDSGTGDLTFNVDSTNGSGTFADWVIGSTIVRSVNGKTGDVTISSVDFRQQPEYLELINDIAGNAFAAGAAQENYDDVLFDIFVNENKITSFTDMEVASQKIQLSPISYVYSGGHDDTLRKIDSTGNQVWSLTGYPNIINMIAVDADGYVYAVSSGTVSKIDSTGTEVWNFTGHTSTVKAVAVDADGYVYSGGHDDTLRKIDSTGNQVWSFTGHTDRIYAVAVDADGYVYSGGRDLTVRKIDSTGNQVWSFTGHVNIVNTIAVDADGYVYSGGRDDTLYKIDSTGNQVWSFTGQDVEAVAVDADGYVYAGSANDFVHKIDSTGNQVWSFTGHTYTVNSIAVDADGYVYSGSRDETLRKIDSTGNQVWSFTGHTDRIYAVAQGRSSSKASGTTKTTTKSLGFTPSKAFLTRVETIKTGGSVSVTAEDGNGNTATLTDGENDVSNFTSGDVFLTWSFGINNDNTSPTLDEYGTYWV